MSSQSYMISIHLIFLTINQRSPKKQNLCTAPVKEKKKGHCTVEAYENQPPPRDHRRPWRRRLHGESSSSTAASAAWYSHPSSLPHLNPAAYLTANRVSFFRLVLAAVLAGVVGRSSGGGGGLRHQRRRQRRIRAQLWPPPLPGALSSPKFLQALQTWISGDNRNTLVWVKHY